MAFVRELLYYSIHDWGELAGCCDRLASMVGGDRAGRKASVTAARQTASRSSENRTADYVEKSDTAVYARPLMDCQDQGTQ